MNTSLIYSFESTVQRCPEKTAVIDKDSSLTFAEIRQRALNVAQAVYGVTEGTKSKPIGIYLPKCTDVAVADIACMYTGNPFMNLDVKTPNERINNILNLIQPAALITSAALAEGLAGFVERDIPIIVVDDVRDVAASEATKVALFELLNTVIDTDPVCIINTSGSTGTPKGVALCHRDFFDFLAWSIETFNFDGSEIIGGLSPIVFDIYDHELFLSMTLGSTIVMLGAELALFPAKLLQELVDKKVNYIFWVPSIMVNIANMDLLESFDLSEIKTVWFAGEVFQTKQFNYWRRHLPQACFANLYGPIEITLDCTYCILDAEFPEDKPLPIGIPCKNTDVLILDDDDTLCGVGQKGELCVRGTSLALGYYNNPEKTAAAFVQNPLNTSYPELIYRTGDVAYWGEDGLIYFSGRKDSLIKHHGYRIELGEIEHIIVNVLKIVKYCCVVYDFANKQIVLFYESDEPIEVPVFRKALASEVPSYMIPGRFECMSELPRNTNGKIDRLALSNVVNG